MHAFILAFILYLPPLPPVPTQPPTGSLPWPVPNFAAVPTSAAPTITLGAAEHSDSFTDQQTALEDQTAAWTAPINQWKDTLGQWMGSGAALPDASSGGDFTTGLTPIDNIGTLYEFATWLGAKIGILFQYMRGAYDLVADFPTFLTVIVTVLIASGAFLLLCKGFDMLMRIFDFGWTISVAILQIIAGVLP